MLYKYAGVFGSIQGSASFVAALGHLRTSSFSLLFDADVGTDEGQPDRYALYIGQGGLGLPHPDDYSSMSDAALKKRRAYLAEIEAMLSAGATAKLLPRYGHAAMAAQVLKFETEIANVTQLPESMRDPFKTFNRRALLELPPGLQFDHYLEGAGISTDDIMVPTKGPSVVLDSIPFFDGVSAMLSRLDADVEYMRTARSYLVFHLVRRLASLGTLGENLYHAHFRFRKEVYGVQKLEERWKMCQDRTGSFMGEALGKEYTDAFFTPAQKDLATRMTSSVVTAFAASFDKQEWMDKETIQAAKSKLDHIRIKIGFPDRPDTYEGMRIVSNNFAANCISASVHRYKRKFGLLGKPIDHSRWLMNAHEVNVSQPCRPPLSDRQKGYPRRLQLTFLFTTGALSCFSFNSNLSMPRLTTRLRTTKSSYPPEYWTSPSSATVTLMRLTMEAWALS